MNYQNIKVKYDPPGGNEARALFIRARQLMAVDVLAFGSMKDAATCDNSYELQNQAYYQSFERNMRAGSKLKHVHGSVPITVLGTYKALKFGFQTNLTFKA